MNPVCDLHTHSVFSDGTYTPEALIDAAVALGLSAIALCDHNTVDGLPDFLAAAAGKPITAIPGAEFSTDYDGTELHVLGLFIDPQFFPQVTELMRPTHLRKEQSNLELTAALARAGYVLDYRKIKARSPNGHVNRAHFAEELTALGYTSTIPEAFKTLLSPEAGFFKEPPRMCVWDVLAFIRSIRAVPVLAHPFLNLTEDQLRSFLPQAKARGLMGMETAYSKYSPATAATAAAMAREFGLLESGGSDFHGARKPDTHLGTGKGNLSVPAQWAEALQNAAARL